MNNVLENTALHRLREDALRNFDLYLKVASAHTVMLAEQSCVTREEAGQLLYMIKNADKSRCSEDVFLPEDLLEKAFPANADQRICGWLRTACSRLDKAATVERLETRNWILQVYNTTLGLCDTLLHAAMKYKDTLMPMYQHFRQAQPGTVGQHYLHVFFALERDLKRLRAAYECTNLCPLGGVNGSGTSWPIDRQRVAQLLGMDDVLENALDCTLVCNDYTAETTLAFSLISQHVGQLAADIYEWSSFEFRAVEVADDLAGSSTLMPQKKNPTGLEGARSYAGQANGWIASVMGALKTGNSLDNDLYYGGSRTSESAEICMRGIRLVQAVINSLTVYEETMARQAQNSWSASSALVDELVLKGWAQSKAMDTVRRLVNTARAENRLPSEVTVEMLCDAACQKVDMDQITLSSLLDARSFLTRLCSDGCANADGVIRQENTGRIKLGLHYTWLDTTQKSISMANKMLCESVDSFF